MKRLLLLALPVLLAGCTKPQANGDATTTPAPAPVPAPDASAASAEAAKPAVDRIATVDGNAISRSEFDLYVSTIEEQSQRQITDAETTFTPIYRIRGEKGVGYYNWGNVRNEKLDALAAASSREADPEKRKALIRQAFLEHNAQVHHIPLHRQFIPWAMRENVTVVHRADNYLEWQWISIK